MQSARQTKRISFKAIFIALLYGYCLVCNTVFLHQHVLQSGEVVQHRHPYPIGKKHPPQHANDKEIRTFSSDFINEFTDGLPDFELSATTFQIAGPRTQGLIPYPDGAVFFTLSPRGPPHAG